MNIHPLSFVLPIVAYLSGAIPFGLLIVRSVAGADIRHMGSGNIGATNVRRCAGTSWGVITLLCDVLKGMLPTLAALYWAPVATPWLAPVVALAAVIGHMFPIYLKLKPSGKGVATALGGFVVLAPTACGLALVAFVIIVAVKRIVSLGSMGAMTLLPLFIWLTTQSLPSTLAGVVAALLILSRHKANIERLIRGEEPTMKR